MASNYAGTLLFFVIDAIEGFYRTKIHTNNGDVQIYETFSQDASG
jgi:hypothetical protein